MCWYLPGRHTGQSLPSMNPMRFGIGMPASTNASANSRKCGAHDENERASIKCGKVWWMCSIVNQTASEMAEIERPVSHVIERSGSVLLYLRSSRSTASSPVKRCPPSVSNSSGSCKACTTSGSQSSRKPNVTYVVTDASSTFRPRPTASRCSLSKLSRSGPMSCSSRRCSGSAAASSSVSATSSSLESPSSSASMTWKRRRLSAISAEVYGLVGMA
mmetsp:Transcript_52174/g.135318  ORF Transcript_52174/g.135318 Transcript_52174/m.135318 type:complete len:217 (-) Transcript_52174:163-813(-)